MAYVILLAEVAAVCLYIGIPILVKYFYTYSPSKEEVTGPQATAGNDRDLAEAEAGARSLMKRVDVDWQKIVRQELYRKDKEDMLLKYLQNRGYQSVERAQRQGIWQYLFKKKLSLEAALTYVQVNAPVLIQDYNNIRMLQHKHAEIGKIADKESKMYETTVLLEGPVYTDTKKIVGSYENLGGDVGIYNYNYGLSAWFFIHEQPPSARLSNATFASLFNYGNKPDIQFNVAEHTLEVHMNSGLDKEDTIFTTQEFPMQKWNNIVINYNGGTLDIFINKVLVSSTINVVPYMSYDEISVGQNNGVSGGVCNVVYFPVPLPLEKVELFYDTLVERDPPMI